MSDNLFERASRIGLRVVSSKGMLMVEDLWNIPLTSKTGALNLDEIAGELNKQLEKQPKKAFVSLDVSMADPALQLAFDIVLHIINVRVAENRQAAQAKARRDQKQQLLAIIAQKESEQLAGQSLEELRAAVAALD